MCVYVYRCVRGRTRRRENLSSHSFFEMEVLREREKEREKVEKQKEIMKRERDLE